MIERVVFTVVGVCCLFKGWSVINSPTGEYFRNIFVEPWGGYLIILIGVIMIVTGLSKQEKK